MKFITLTNNGYLEYTRNLIESLRRIGIDENCEEFHLVPLKVYCIGQESYDNLDYKNKELIEGLPKETEEFQKFREGDWNKVVVQKFNIIHRELMKGEDVLFTDGDIVWLNNRFQRDIQNRIDDYDILFQNDKQDDNDNSELCSGIIFAKCNQKNLNLFNPENIDMDNFKCDQIHFNKIKGNLSYDKLPLKKYPNGRFYYTMKPERPYCIHFNYVVGEMKKTFMKQYDYWLIE
jgi:hypothetical protein